MPDADTTLRALEPLFKSLERAHVVYYMHVSATCVFIYDYLTTFADEVAIVWPAPWHAGKVFFLIERYTIWPELLFLLYNELYDVSPKFCHNVFTYLTWSTIFAIIVTDAILILRTWALWGGSRPILISLALLLVAVTAASAVIVVYYVEHTVFMRASDAIAVLQGCVIKSATNRIAIVWILLTAFELVIVILTLVPGFKHFRSGHTSNLITSLYRDGIVYFFYLFSLSLANWMFIYNAPEYVALFGPVQRSFNAILSCKIIMHLQSASLVRNADTISGRYASTAMPLQPTPSGQYRRRFVEYGEQRAPTGSVTSTWFGAA